jgi:hypothetical protein
LHGSAVELTKRQSDERDREFKQDQILNKNSSRITLSMLKPFSILPVRPEDLWNIEDHRKSTLKVIPLRV